MLNEIKKILDGIDKTETEAPSGWWETSTGAKFGASILDQIESLFTNASKPVVEADMESRCKCGGKLEYNRCLACGELNI